MKLRFFSLFVFCALGFVQIGTAQKSANKPQVTAPRHYPNPYDTSDPNRPVAQNPSTWKDFPADINTSAKMQEAYEQASKNFDGYKLYQLGKLEYDKGITYGTLNPNKIIAEAYRIAVNNQDPFLAFYLTQFNSEENFSAELFQVREMVKTTYQIALSRKDTAVLNRLCNLEDSRDIVILEDVTTNAIRKQALFINHKNYAPYPNLYDNPDKSKPVDQSPFLWNDFPTNIATEAQLKEAYTIAQKNNDGYRLLQLAKIVAENPLSKTLTAELLLSKAYAIAQYNIDPFLMLYVTILEKEKNILKNVQPADIFRKTYHASLERRDTKALRYLYSYEQKYDFLQDTTPKMILQKMMELKDAKPIL